MFFKKKEEKPLEKSFEENLSSLSFFELKLAWIKNNDFKKASILSREIVSRFNKLRLRISYLDYSRDNFGMMDERFKNNYPDSFIFFVDFFYWNYSVIMADQREFNDFFKILDYYLEKISSNLSNEEKYKFLKNLEKELERKITNSQQSFYLGRSMLERALNALMREQST